jgi:hypothetical protein
MLRSRGVALFALSLCALVVGFNSAHAGTIIKLDLGSVAPDISYNGTTLSTVDDLVPATTGDQDTGVEFTDFLESVEADISSPPASFSMSGLTASGSAFVFLGQNVLQNFTGGSFTLYAADNSILLSGTLATSALSGPVGFPSGGLFTTTFGTVTGGTLQPYIDPNSLVLSMNFTDVQTTGGPVGFFVSPPAATPAPTVHMGTLQAFSADASISIAAEVPEPGTMVLFSLAALAVAPLRSRRA